MSSLGLSHRDLSVQDLVDETQLEGDINYRFSTRSNAIDGIRGHQKLQKSRGKGYVPEFSVKASFAWADITMNLKGRLDGYLIDGDLLIVDEIKTVRIDIQKIPQSIQNQHWAQVGIYGYMLAKTLGMSRVNLRLCYFNLDENKEYQLVRETDLAHLKDMIETRLNLLADHLRAQMAWVQYRNEGVGELQFPYGEFRLGQREMAVNIYKTFQQSGQLVIQAPTGIGKTMASLYPGVTALGKLGYEKLFYLSAKTSGQNMARTAVADLKKGGLALRDITITAKRKICFNPEVACEPSQCDYAKDYYQKLPAVRAEVMSQNISLSREVIEEIAERHTLCPFELSLDLALDADIVICDYNYVFDPAVYLRRFFGDRKRQFMLLLDEAHNLPDRARDMYSAEFSKAAVLKLRTLLKADQPLIAKQLQKINTEFLALIKPNKAEMQRGGGFACEEKPEKLLKNLRLFTESAEAWLQLNQPSYFHQDLLDLYFDALRVLRICESADEQYQYLILEKGASTWFKIFCINPGPRLAETFSQIKSSVCFSATLGPRSYFENLLGIRPEAPWYEVASPFDPNNLGIFISSSIDTRYRSRARSLLELVQTMADVISCQPGNYLVYFPSYAYLAEAAELFGSTFGDIETVSQSPGMTMEQRGDFIGRFREQSGLKDILPSETLLGFALMGGIFGEGIDLKGTRLIGVLIVGPGIPQIGLERDLIRQYFDSGSAQGQGFEFAYQYPGMNKVLQTAGRVIRSESDKGIVCLLDQRFTQPSYRALLPDQWRVETTQSATDMQIAVSNFWTGTN